MQRKYILLVACFFIFSTSFGQTNNHNNHFEVGLGLVLSSDYKDAMIAAFSNDYELSGTFGWIDLEVGYAVTLAKNFHFIPRARFLISRVEIKAFSNLPSSQYANFVFLPTGTFRYSLYGKNASFYADVHLSPVFPHSDLNRIDFESDGAAFGVELGTILVNEYELGIGFLRAPVRVLSGSFQSRPADFGGFSLAFRRRF